MTSIMRKRMKHSMRVVFMGTPDFAVWTLEEILRAGHEVVLAVTQPDKPKGRGNAMQFPPVKEAAAAHNIPVFQPNRIRLPENVSELKKYNPDIIVVAAFGQILTEEILNMPEFGCINVHASLLPKYRGAAPIQWAVINGERETGVTIMRMDAGIDTGDVIACKKVPLAEEETGGSLFDKLAEEGAKLCVEAMAAIADGTAVYTPQNHKEATHTSMIRKELGSINWKKPAVELERLVRGLNPWPSAYTRLDGKNFKIWRAKALAAVSSCRPGSVVKAEKDELWVQTGDGILALLEVQLEGRKRMDAGAFLRGYPMEQGCFFEQENRTIPN